MGQVSGTLQLVDLHSYAPVGIFTHPEGALLCTQEALAIHLKPAHAVTHLITIYGHYYHIWTYNPRFYSLGAAVLSFCLADHDRTVVTVSVPPKPTKTGGAPVVEAWPFPGVFFTANSGGSDPLHLHRNMGSSRAALEGEQEGEVPAVAAAAGPLAKRPRRRLDFARKTSLQHGGHTHRAHRAAQKMAVRGGEPAGRLGAGGSLHAAAGEDSEDYVASGLTPVKAMGCGCVAVFDPDHWRLSAWQVGGGH